MEENTPINTTEKTPMKNKPKSRGWKDYSRGAQAAIITFAVILGLAVIGVIILTIFLVIGNGKSSSSVSSSVSSSLVAARPNPNRGVVRKPVKTQQLKELEEPKIVNPPKESETNTSTESKMMKSVQRDEGLSDFTKQNVHFRDAKNEEEAKNNQRVDESIVKIKPMSNRNRFD
jgi:hypothetical protein